jgi:hypothetical protein
MFPEHFDHYCIIKGYFYESDSFAKSLQYRVMKFSEHVFYYPSYEVLEVSDDKDGLIKKAETLSQ